MPGPASSAADQFGALQVAIDAGPLLGPKTGIGLAVDQLVSAFDRRDDIALTRYACSFRGRLEPGMRRLPIPAALAHRAWARCAYPRLDRFLRPAALVHGTNYVVPPSRLPRVVSVYDCWFLREAAADHSVDAAVARAGRVLRRATDAGAVVHASSQATADAVGELLGTERIHVIHLAALPARTAPVEQAAPIAELADAPYVLALGTLERRKNLPRLVAAFDELAARHADVRLVLAGADSDDRDAVNDAIDALRPAARARVAMSGRIDDQAKAWLLSHAAVLAYPSLDEGFGFPLLEAMQNDVPVVASRAGSIPEVAGDAALLVDHDDVAALTEALDAALTDSALRHQLIAAGRRRLGVFSWDTTAAQLVDLYRDVIQQAQS